MECGYELAGKLLKLERRPSAIVAEYDDIALGAIRRITEAGLKIPDDISVIGFDFCGSRVQIQAIRFDKFEGSFFNQKKQSH